MKTFLRGKWFHSHNDKGEIAWQGQILAEDGEYCLVQLYDWLSKASIQHLIHRADMKSWVFYDTNKAMNDAYEQQPPPRRLSDEDLRRHRRERKSTLWFHPAAQKPNLRGVKSPDEEARQPLPADAEVKVTMSSPPPQGTFKPVPTPAPPPSIPNHQAHNRA